MPVGLCRGHGVWPGVHACVCASVRVCVARKSQRACVCPESRRADLSGTFILTATPGSSPNLLHPTCLTSSQPLSAREPWKREWALGGGAGRPCMRVIGFLHRTGPFAAAGHHRGSLCACKWVRACVLLVPLQPAADNALPFLCLAGPRRWRPCPRSCRASLAAATPGSTSSATCTATGSTCRRLGRARRDSSRRRGN